MLNNNCCLCFGKCTKNRTTCSTNCITLGTILVEPKNSVAPCGETGLVKFTCFDTCSCKGDLEWSVLKVSKPTWITVNSITKDGLTFTTTSAAEINEPIEVTIKAVCDDGRGDYGKVIILLKSNCKGVSCPPDQICDKCTGECVDRESDLSTAGSNGAGTSLNTLIIN